MQKPFSFDPVTIEKIKHSLLLATGGFIVAAVPLLLQDQQVVTYLQDHPMIALAVGAYIPFFLNLVKEYIQGDNSSHNS